MTKIMKIILACADATTNSALVSGVKTLRPDWQVVSMGSGDSILQLAAREVTECVITDVALEDMSGSDLLSALQSVSPATARLTLTHDPEHEVILESTRCNHRFLNRAAPTEVLVSTIESSLRLREVLCDDSLKQSIKQIRNLPSLPDIYQQMVEELVEPQSSLRKVATIIEADAGLTATVLKIVNSAFYGLNQRVESVAQAVALLGVHLIKNITLTAKVFMQFEAAEVDMNRLRRLNDDANRVGAICNHFARLGCIPRSVADHTQIAGMLSNVGQLVSLLKPASAVPQAPELLGAHLLSVWMMPDSVVEAIALQYETPPSLITPPSPMLILHIIRYLEQHLPDAGNRDMRQQCQDYLQNFIEPSLVEKWLDSFSDQQQLVAQGDDGNVRAA